MESRIQLRKFRILLKIEIQNPCSTEKDWNQESTTCNLESKTVLDSLTWGEIEALVSRTIVKLLVEQSRFSTRLIYIDHRQLVSRTWITNGKMHGVTVTLTQRDLRVKFGANSFFKCHVFAAIAVSCLALAPAISEGRWTHLSNWRSREPWNESI